MTRSPRALALSILMVLASATTAAAQTAYVPDAGVEGTVGSATQDLQGRSNAATSAACASCTTAGAKSDVPALAILGGLIALGTVVARRRHA